MAHGDITHTEIPFDDQRRATAFYREVARWDVQERPDFEGYPTWRAPNQVTGGGLGRREGGFQDPRFYVEVDSIDDAVERAIGAGGSLVDEKGAIGEAGWVAVIADPDENQIGLYEGAAAASTPADGGPAHGDVPHVDIPVTDTARAVDFYRSLFGWDARDMPGFEGYPLWTGPSGYGGGGLAPRSEAFTQPRSYLQVDSIEEALAAVAAHGGHALRSREVIDPTSWWALFEDSEGNVMGLVEGSTGG